MRALAAVVLLMPALAHAEEKKADAKALMASGLKLYNAKDYLGALAVFQDAYAKYPSAKILLNIATTQVALDRKADAANAYQRYLDSPDAERKTDVEKVLADLDKAVGVLHVAVSPDDAELQLDEGEWRPAKELHIVRVPPGDVVVRARLEHHKLGEQKVALTAGGTAQVTLTLIATADPVAVTTQTKIVEVPVVQAEKPLTRLGAIATANVDPVHKGGAAVVGLTVELVPHLEAELAALLGPTSGAYAGARVVLLDGRIHPTIAAGVPLFISSGARVSVRGAAGIEAALARRVSVVAELGVEHVFNAEMDRYATLFVPALGLAARF